jgi:hypothetical protein
MRGRLIGSTTFAIQAAEKNLQLVIINNDVMRSIGIVIRDVSGVQVDRQCSAFKKRGVNANLVFNFPICFRRT